MIEQLVIAVSATGALVVQRQIEAIGRAAREAGAPVLGLSDLLASVAAGGALYKIGQQLNTLQNLRNGLRTVTGSALELEQAQNALFDVSQRTRSSWEDNIKVFVRVKRALAEYGVSSMEAINITESLNKALQVGGATGQERASVMLQLTQSMASGRVQGDELRSLLENSTILGNLLAKQLGVTRGEIRKLGSEGKISVTDLVLMFRNFRQEIEDAFAKTTPTIEQAFTTLQNEATRALAAVDKSFNISGGIVQFLGVIQQNIDAIIRLAPAMGLALTSAFIAARVAGLELGAVLGVLAFNPFTAWITGIGAVVAALYMFSDQIKITIDGVTTLQDLGAEVWDSFKQGIVDFASAKEWQTLEMQLQRVNSNLHFGDINENLRDIAAFADDFGNTLNGILAVTQAWATQMGIVVRNGFKLAINNATQGVEDLYNWFADQVNDKFGGTGATIMNNLDLSKYKLEVYNSGIDFAEEFNKGYASAGSPILDMITRAQQGAKARGIARTAADDAWASAGQWIGGDNPASALGLAGGPLKNVPKPGGADSEAKKLNRELDSILKRSGTVQAAQVELARAEDVLSRAVSAGLIPLSKKNEILADMKLRLQDNLDPLGKINQDLDNETRLLYMSNQEREIQNQLLQYENQLREKGVALSPMEKAGLEDRLRTISLMKDQADFVQQAFSGAFNQMGDALADFVTTGKLDFKSLVQSMIRDLIRLMIQLMIVKPLMNAVMGAFGGMFGTATPMGQGGIGSDAAASAAAGLPGFASGGAFRVGGQGGVDSQMVAFRASPDETVTVSKPEQSTKGGGGLNVNIINQNGSEVSARQDERGQLEIIVANKVRSMVAGGDLNDVMFDTFRVAPNVRSR